VVEICTPEKQGERENYYLQKYLPILNSNFNSNKSELVIYKTLSDILITKQLKLEFSSKYSEGISIWAYKYLGTIIEKEFVKYDSINKANIGTSISRDTLAKYLNTNIPIKNLLFYSKPINDYSLTLNLVKESSLGLTIDSNIAKQVWVYKAKTGELVNNKPFSSREQTAKFLNIRHNQVKYYVDNNKPYLGLDGYWLSSRSLTNKEIQYIIQIASEE